MLLCLKQIDICVGRKNLQLLYLGHSCRQSPPGALNQISSERGRKKQLLVWVALSLVLFSICTAPAPGLGQRRVQSSTGNPEHPLVPTARPNQQEGAAKPLGLGRCENGFRLNHHGKSSGPQRQLSSSVIYLSHDQHPSPRLPCGTLTNQL